MRKLSIITGLGLASGLFLAAGSSIAQEVTLDCEADSFTRSWSEVGQQDEESPRGTWRFTVDPTARTVHLENSVPFLINGSADTLNGSARDVRVTENEISFCLNAAGCGVQLSARHGGTYSVERSTLDRRQSRFHIRVRENDPSVRYRSDTQYFGQCTPAAERQF